MAAVDVLMQALEKTPTSALPPNKAPAVVPFKITDKDEAGAVAKTPEGFLPKRKSYPGFARLNSREKAAITLYLNTRVDSSVVWRDVDANTTREDVFILLEGKEETPDSVMEVLVLIFREALHHAPVRALVTRPSALAWMVSETAAEAAFEVMHDSLIGHKDAALILMPIILHGHYHLLTMDRRVNSYRHYSSLQSETYDRDALAMVSVVSPLADCAPFFLYAKLIFSSLNLQRHLLETVLEIDTGANPFKDLPLEHVRSCPQQKSKTVDCPVYCMRYMEQLAFGEELSIPTADVPYLRLQYVARILVDGMCKKVIPLPQADDDVEKNVKKKGKKQK